MHDVAAHLTAWLAEQYPTLAVNHDAVLFGAATHDIGKIVHVEELSGPGSRHEPAGRQLLLDAGIDSSLARFAATHASWQTTAVEIEDLIVSLADKIWKAKRVPDLEQLVVDRLVAASGQEPWQAFLNLDDILDTIAADADHRLAFQNVYPTTTS
ncbi:HD domain-containing protein [Actinoplanes subtropicus]|uniref:HD domain-containing protein n=1 Tax=Actinoplanes subtropicus TaxID=543632 RepID=UPI000A743AF4|nr:HD domain-containing protein [Actinoplanes subtropicus]